MAKRAALAMNTFKPARRRREGSPQVIPLTPLVLEIMNRYKNHLQCCNNGYVLPVLSNQKMNSYLKEIAEACGINKNLTFHIARHTFAATVTLSNVVPIETVSKMRVLSCYYQWTL